MKSWLATWVMATAAMTAMALAQGPELSSRGVGPGASDASDVSDMRLAEIQQKARRLQQEGAPVQARALLRRWLDHQRANRLGPTDAEGRRLLAQQYEDLIGDRETATALLQEAWAIDPQSRALAEAFTRRGFRLESGSWVAPAAAGESTPAAASPRPVRPGGGPLEGMTREEVQATLGKPNRVARLATQGQVLEQWIYLNESNRPFKFVNFVIQPGQPRPTASTVGSLAP